MTSADEDLGSHRRRGDGRRGPAHARTSPRWPGGDVGRYPAPPPEDAESPAYQADFYQAEYPEWTTPPQYQAGYPEWSAPPAPQAEYQDWIAPPPAPQAGYQGWVAPPAPQAEYPQWTAPPAPPPRYPEWTGPAGYQDGYQQPEYQGWIAPPPAPAEYPGPYGQHALHPDHPSWPETRFAPWPDGGAPVVQDTITDVAGWGLPDAGYAQPAREQLWDAGSSQLANWIIEDANEQAAAITREARNQASSSLAAAQAEAAELVRRTGEQAALTIEAAELQAAEIRQTMMKLTSELTGMAAYVTQSLGPAAPAPTAPVPAAFAPPAPAPAAPPSPAPDPVTAFPPPVPPGSAPAGRRAAQSAATSAAPARSNPGSTSAATPGGQPSAKSRQAAAVRVMSVFTAAMVLFALTAGGAEVALHGFKFFVFRSAGTGETAKNGLQENQGPGQPGAPGATGPHQQVQKP